MAETRSILHIDILYPVNVHSYRALIGTQSRREENCEALHALSRMDDNPTDISGTRGAGHQHAVRPQFEVWVFIGIVDIGDDLLWIKQDHEIMRQERDRVHLQFEV